MKSIRLAIVLAGVCLVPFFLDRVDPGQAARGEGSHATAITSILADQQSAWNRGDVDGFMKGYWDSPELTFAGSSGITRGWQPVLERYRRNYPDHKAMGHLDFSEVEVRPLGKDAALVLGRWHLRRDSDELGGVFTLVFQRFPEGWRIIHDHTSADAKKS
ncbi:MAG: nuclear transport factor 2 family protein [Candidatus Acidiferrum sp.]